MTDIDDKIAFEMFRLRVAGQSERKIATKYGVTTTVVRSVIARMLPAVDTAMRVQVHALELQRYDELYEAHFENASVGRDQGATALCLKIADQRSSLLGLNAPTRMDFQLVEQTSAPPLNTTQRIEQALNDLAAEGKAKAITSHEDDPDQLH